FKAPEIRARLADHLQHRPRSRPGHWPLYRRVLQSRPAPFRPRLHKPGSVRKNGRQLSQSLSTKAGQVQTRDTAIAWVRSHNNARVEMNVYFHVNPTAPGFKTKADAADITSIEIVGQA